MHFHRRPFRVGLLFTILLLAVSASWASGAGDAQALLQSDRKLLQAFKNSDKAAIVPLLDANLTWINANGLRLTKKQVLDDLPPVANSSTEIEARFYDEVAIIRANLDRMNVLRVWVRRGTTWYLIHYQEVLQVPKSEPPTADQSSAECENPCKSVPFQPETQSEREAIASWQGVMKAMASNDPDAYAPLIADEFVATDTHHDRPYTKADRIAQINKQRLAGAKSAPPALLGAQMFDFGETVMMIAHEQRRNSNAFFNTRMWVKREGRWQMLFSFNTRMEENVLK